MRRNKRCLLAYHRARTEKIIEGLWKGEDVVGSGDAAGDDGGSGAGAGAARTDGDGEGRARDANALNSLAPEEEEYARGYAALLAAYKGQWTDVDLTGSLEPPRDLFVDVRVLRDAGEIQTEYGYADIRHWSSFKRSRMLMLDRAINLTKNSQFYVRQGDVERLIAQGYLKKLS
jgi:GINS complex subunit 1